MTYLGEWLIQVTYVNQLPNATKDDINNGNASHPIKFDVDWTKARETFTRAHRNKFYAECAEAKNAMEQVKRDNECNKARYSTMAIG